MAPRIAPLLLLALACSTTSGVERLTTRNRAGLAALSPGMERAQVLRTMESQTYYVREGPSRRRVRVTNPYRELAIPLQSGSRVDILYYYTQNEHEDALVTSAELTPVVLEDDRFVGVGWEALEQNYADDVIAIARQDELEIEMLAEKDRELGGVDPVEREFRESIHRGSHLIRLGTGFGTGTGLGLGR